MGETDHFSVEWREMDEDKHGLPVWIERRPTRTPVVLLERWIVHDLRPSPQRDVSLGIGNSIHDGCADLPLISRTLALFTFVPIKRRSGPESGAVIQNPGLGLPILIQRDQRQYR